jgi:hypothetical protein
VIKTVVLIPRRDDAGAAFAADLFQELERRLAAFGGATRTTSLAGVCYNW